MHTDILERNSIVLKEHFLTPLKVLHFLLTAALFYFTWQYFYEFHAMGYNAKYNFVVPFIYTIVFFYLNHIYHGYFVSFSKPKKLIFSQSLAALISVGFIYFGTAFVWMIWRSPLILIGYFFLQVLLNVIWSYAADAIYFKFHKPLKTVFVYSKETDLDRITEVANHRRKFNIVEKIKINDENLFEKLEGVEALFILGASKSLRDKLANWALRHGAYVFALQNLDDILMTNASHLQSYGTPLLALNAKNPSFSYLFIKRILSFLLALFGIIVASPIMLCAALAIKVYDPGPVFFKQERMGRGMKLFTCYKFRTMSVKAPIMHPNQMKDAKSYLSPLGNFLRSSSIDELPQLFNILKGDMSFIGPRPIPTYEGELIEKRAELGIYRIRPGLSGLAQVMGRNQVNDAEKLMFDYEYLTRMNFFLDVKIFFMTVFYVILRRGVFANESTF